MFREIHGKWIVTYTDAQLVGKKIKEVDENGNSFLLNYVPGYSSDYRLYANSMAAEDYVERLDALKTCRQIDFSGLPLSQLKSIIDTVG